MDVTAEHVPPRCLHISASSAVFLEVVAWGPWTALACGTRRGLCPGFSCDESFLPNLFSVSNPTSRRGCWSQDSVALALG